MPKFDEDRTITEKIFRMHKTAEVSFLPLDYFLSSFPRHKPAEPRPFRLLAFAPIPDAAYGLKEGDAPRPFSDIPWYRGITE